MRKSCHPVATPQNSNHSTFCSSVLNILKTCWALNDTTSRIRHRKIEMTQWYITIEKSKTSLSKNLQTRNASKVKEKDTSGAGTILLVTVIMRTSLDVHLKNRNRLVRVYVEETRFSKTYAPKHALQRCVNNSQDMDQVRTHSVHGLVSGWRESDTCIQQNTTDWIQGSHAICRDFNKWRKKWKC